MLELSRHPIPESPCALEDGESPCALGDGGVAAAPTPELSCEFGDLAAVRAE